MMLCIKATSPVPRRNIDFLAMLECLFFHMPSFNVSSVDVQYRYLRIIDGKVFCITVDGNTQMFRPLSTLLQLSLFLCNLSTSVQQVPDLTRLSLEADAHPNASELLKNIGDIWGKAHGPAPLQQKCGQVIRHSVRSREDCKQLGLPEQILAHVTQSALAQVLVNIIKEN